MNQETIDLVNAFVKALNRMSFFNAAESNWAGESSERNTHKAYLRQTAVDLQKRGVDPHEIAVKNPGCYSTYDWKGSHT